MLRAGDPERDLGAVWGGGVGARFFGGGQAGEDVAKGNGVGADGEGGTPFLAGKEVSTSGE